jgi:phosphatidylserine synthase
MSNVKYTNLLFPVGATLLFAASLFKLNDQPYIENVFAAGALLLISYHAILAYNFQKEDKTLQRLYRIGFISSLFLAIATYFVFTGSNSWIVMVLIYALTTLYLSFRLK